MSVDRKPCERFDKGKNTALNNAKRNMAIVVEHIEKLRAVRNGDKMARYAIVLSNKLNLGEELFEWEYSEIDNLYERTISAVYDVPFVPKHFDRKRGNLRHPK